VYSTRDRRIDQKGKGGMHTKMEGQVGGREREREIKRQGERERAVCVEKKSGLDGARVSGRERNRETEKQRKREREKERELARKRVRERKKEEIEREGGRESSTLQGTGRSRSILGSSETEVCTHAHTRVYIYIYIYIYGERERG
jgi:hypothetical protein